MPKVAGAYFNPKKQPTLNYNDKPNNATFTESQKMEKTKLEIAENILKNCYWGNTNMTPEYIVENIKKDESLVKQIFSAIFQNSLTMIEDLKIIDDQNLIKELIISQNKRLGHFKRDYYEKRIDYLIEYYKIENAGIRKKLENVIY
ncbi:hypothetical protein ACLQ0S_001621 [Campylobacter jejuni]|uniref:hypothetical protein n=1 Tax=Campylobacter jejuni TaxID=197 RepID=UPI000AA057F1|nr:hypothetical protein [Campylobacter jejuni]